MAVTDTLLRDVAAANSANDERHPGIGESGNTIVFQSDRPGGQGRWDLWDYDRTTQLVTQPGPDYDSAGDDIEPSLKWPY